MREEIAHYLIQLLVKIVKSIQAKNVIGTSQKDAFNNMLCGCLLEEHRKLIKLDAVPNLTYPMTDADMLTSIKGKDWNNQIQTKSNVWATGLNEICKVEFARIDCLIVNRDKLWRGFKNSIMQLTTHTIFSDNREIRNHFAVRFAVNYVRFAKLYVEGIEVDSEILDFFHNDTSTLIFLHENTQFFKVLCNVVKSCVQKHKSRGGFLFTYLEFANGKVPLPAGYDSDMDVCPNDVFQHIINILSIPTISKSFFSKDPIVNFQTILSMINCFQGLNQICIKSPKEDKIWLIANELSKMIIRVICALANCRKDRFELCNAIHFVMLSLRWSRINQSIVKPIDVSISFHHSLHFLLSKLVCSAEVNQVFDWNMLIEQNLKNVLPEDVHNRFLELMESPLQNYGYHININLNRSMFGLY